MHEVLKRPLDRTSNVHGANAQLSEAELLALEEAYCSHGDTVHYQSAEDFRRRRGLFSL
jgi:hypothetical protein